MSRKIIILAVFALSNPLHPLGAAAQCIPEASMGLGYSPNQQLLSESSSGNISAYLSQRRSSEYGGTAFPFRRRLLRLPGKFLIPGRIRATRVEVLQTRPDGQSIVRIAFELDSSRNSYEADEWTGSYQSGFSDSPGTVCIDGQCYQQ